MKVLVTGSAGFIGGYVVKELLDRGHTVVGVDNYSKYGTVKRSYDGHPRYEFQQIDVRQTDKLTVLLRDCDHLIAGAALVGGIAYFHAYPYDIISINDQILCSTIDAALSVRMHERLQKITYISSSMVFESATMDDLPSTEGDELQLPPPESAYGFQKLALEYYARAAFQQYKMPFTIVRPFNCVGVGEGRALGSKEILSGNVKLAMSHVVPDLIQKALKQQRPFRILGKGTQVRHYTYGGDVARGIVMAMENPKALNEDFNISSRRSTTVLELAQIIWEKINPGEPIMFVHDDPFPHDVQCRVPSTTKARLMLGFEAETKLEEMIDHVIPWVTAAMADGRI